MSILQQHALQNWANPSVDKQFIFKPIRVTPPAGATFNFFAGGEAYQLPTNARSHMFQIGKFSPLELSLPAPDTLGNDTVWVSLANGVIASKVQVELYNAKGVRIPLSSVHYSVSKNNNLLFVVEHDNALKMNLATEDIFIRVYKGVAMAQIAGHNIHVDWVRAKTPQDIISLQARMAPYAALPGTLYITVNGILVKEPLLTQAAVGDTIEYLYVSAVAKILTYELNNLDYFESTLDSLQKYVLISGTQGFEEIEFFDDNDIFIVGTDSLGRAYGLTYVRNEVNAIRQLTNTDISLPVAYVNDLKRHLLELYPSIVSFTIKVYVKLSYMGVSVGVTENNLMLLNSLTTPQRRNAIVGTNSVLADWTASVLEESPFSKMQSIPLDGLSDQHIYNAYGYFGACKAIGKSLQQTYMYGNILVANMPKNVLGTMMAYEYGVDGKLLHIINSISGATYFCVDAATTRVEFIHGIAATTNQDRKGITNILLPTTTYRVYKCTVLPGGVYDNLWVDVTGSNLYYITNGVLINTNVEFDIVFLVRSEGLVIVNDISVAESNGSYSFKLSDVIVGNLTYTVDSSLPYAHTDVYLNQHKLVNGVGYIINYPEVIILDKKWLLPNTNTQQIHVRQYGLLDDDGFNTLETGFVINGKLSKDRRFDYFDTLDSSVCIDGGVDFLLPSYLDGNQQNTNLVNGTPYAIEGYIVPTKSLVGIDTCIALKQAYQKLKDASNYVNTLKPIPPIETNTIVDRYALYSPIVANVISSLLSGALVAPVKDENFGNNILAAIAPIKTRWSALDPIGKVDPRYCVIHPINHNNAVNVTYLQYAVLLEVIKFLEVPDMNLSSFINIV